jgi:hypothetical protein
MFMLYFDVCDEATMSVLTFDVDGAAAMSVLREYCVLTMMNTLSPKPFV